MHGSSDITDHIRPRWPGQLIAVLIIEDEHVCGRAEHTHEENLEV